MDLDAATAEFEAASDALTKAQEAYDEKRTAANNKARERAQAAFVAAGQAVRRAKDPERALDVLEYERHLAQKAKVKAAVKAKQVAS